MICRSFAALRPYTNRVRRAITDGFLPESGCVPNLGDDFGDYSCKTTVSSDLLTLILPLYSMKPNFLNLFMKKFTRERVVPTMLARVSCETLGKMRTG